MSKVTRYAIWLNAIALVLVLTFQSNLALVLPVAPRREFWVFLWPPYVGANYIVIPDKTEYASLIVGMVALASLILVGIWSAAAKLKFGRKVQSAKEHDP